MIGQLGTGDICLKNGSELEKYHVAFALTKKKKNEEI